MNKIKLLGVQPVKVFRKFNTKPNVVAFYSSTEIMGRLECNADFTYVNRFFYQDENKMKVNFINYICYKNKNCYVICHSHIKGFGLKFKNNPNFKVFFLCPRIYDDSDVVKNILSEQSIENFLSIYSKKLSVTASVPKLSLTYSKNLSSTLSHSDIDYIFQESFPKMSKKPIYVGDIYFEFVLNLNQQGFGFKNTKENFIHNPEFDEESHIMIEYPYFIFFLKDNFIHNFVYVNNPTKYNY